MTTGMDWLLDPASPGVLYLALRDLVGCRPMPRNWSRPKRPPIPKVRSLLS